MDINSEIQRARQYLQKGDRQTARSILAAVVQAEPANIKAWLVLSVAVENEEQRKYCLNRVLQLDPANADARAMLGGSERRSGARMTSGLMPPGIVYFALAFLLIVSFGGVFGWWYAYGPCGKVPVRNSLLQITAEIQKWQVALKQSGSAYSYLLNDPYSATLQQLEQGLNNFYAVQAQSTASFQQISQEINNIEAPSCMLHAKNTLASGISDYSKGWAAASSFSQTLYMQNSMVEIDSSFKELLAINDCAPFCNYSEQTGLAR